MHGSIDATFFSRMPSFIPHPLQDPKTIYQQFTFVKSIVDRDQFKEAVQRILLRPVTQMVGNR